MKVDEFAAEGRVFAKYLRREDAAQYLRDKYGFRCSSGLLDKLASLGGGPVFRKARRDPIYAPEDLDAWAEARISAPLSKASDVPA
jgi:hypothetical protein